MVTNQTIQMVHQYY